MRTFVALLSLAALLASAPARAGAGHDHDAPAASAESSDSPRRLPDGSVFLPKPSQRQWQLRTLLAEKAHQPMTLELTGRVLADPNSGGRVQPTAPGRIEAGPQGLPRLGQAVRRGEVLAVARSAAAPIDRANQVALAAELRANLQTARRRAERLAQLEGTVPQKDIDAAQADANGLAQRLAAVGASVEATEALRAPVSGVIAASNVVAGQVVDARDTLFEIVDASRLLVEAQAFDATLAARVASASAIAAPGQAPVALAFSGAGHALREGAIPLQFRTLPGGPALALQQPVRVLVQTRDTVEGFALPASAVVRNPANQDVVWLHTGAEQFEPRVVRSVALDGARVSVLDGLQPGDRVVTQGAPLLNQVR
ncbi:HlyD family efflux transporter periplasmic adaptor subunit [Xylophilus sp. GW821-FHT01B05]